MQSFLALNSLRIRQDITGVGQIFFTEKEHLFKIR